MQASDSSRNHHGLFCRRFYGCGCLPMSRQHHALLAAILLVSPVVRGAEPLAQRYVVVHKVRDLKDPAKAVCVGTPDILQLPSGRLIASMELWLKRPTSVSVHQHGSGQWGYFETVAFFLKIGDPRDGPWFEF